MTPQPGGVPAEQSFFSKNKVPLLVGGCLLLVVCCVGTSFLSLVFSQDLGNGSARVDCGTPGPGGVDCEVKRTSGAGGLRPCWDLEITCQNGGVMTGNACGSLPAGADSVTVNMPVSSFSNQDACDVPKSGAVQRLIVNPE